MKNFKPHTLALALAVAFPSIAMAQSNDELMKELRALKDRVGQLESALKAKDAPKAADADKQWGMTPAQVQDFNRVTLKTEALEDAMEAQGFKGLKISGQMDPTYIYNRAQNRAGFQFLNAVGDDLYNYDNSYFGMALIDFQKEMEGGTKWRLTLAPSRGVGSVVDGQSIVHEASVSIPLGDLQTRLIAGQIPDWSGYEYLPPTQNKLITHNLLFDFTLPTAYTGAGMEVISGKWDVKALLANMNATKRASGEKTPVIAYRVDYSKGEYNGFGFAGVHGKAANLVNGGPDTSLNLFEADAYFIRGDWTLQGQVSYGQQKNAAIAVDPNTGELRDARWYGASALAAYKFTPRFEGIARVDYINNSRNGGGLLGYGNDSRNGIGQGMVQDGEGGWTVGDAERGANRMALSVGVGYAFNANTTFKAEYRLDRASQAVFVDVRDGSYSKSNHLLGASMVLSF